MSNVFLDMQEELIPILRSGDLRRCESLVVERLESLPKSPFHISIELNITNSPVEIAAHFDGFFRQEADRIKIEAAYSEMNGFDINTDRWFFDVFAYEQYGGHDNYEWIAEWQSGVYQEMTIKGLERLQEVFASSAFFDKEFEDACCGAGLLVVIKFQKIIRRAARLMRELQCPLLVTAHDYDFIYEVSPVNSTGQP